MVYVYKITVNSKAYVGVSNDPDGRLKTHRSADSYIGNALRKHGLDDFDIIDQADSYEEAFKLEVHYIVDLNTLHPNGYNLTAGGEGCTGFNYSEAVKTKMSDAHIGVKLSPEHCTKISKALTSKKKSPEHCAKISTSMKGKKNAKR